jgi:hypothetical protein
MGWRKGGGFRRDLKVGQRGERRVLNLCRSRRLLAGRNRARRLKGRRANDLFARLPSGERVTLEVKLDATEAETGNVAVEYHNPKADRPSGLLATTADVWVFVLLDGSVWAAAVPALRAVFLLGSRGPGFVKTARRCGDGNSDARIYRRRELFAAAFTRLDHLGDDELSGVLRKLSASA